MKKKLKTGLDSLGKKICIEKQGSGIVLFMTNIDFDIVFASITDLLNRIEAGENEFTSHEKIKIFFERSIQLKLNIENFSKQNNTEIKPSDVIMKYYGDLLPEDFVKKSKEFQKKDGNNAQEEFNMASMVSLITSGPNIYLGQKRLDKYKDEKIVNVEILGYSLKNEELEFLNAIIYLFLNLTKNGIEFEAGTSILFDISIPRIMDILNKTIKKYLKEKKLKYNEKEILKYYEMDFI